jgi:hypothetical protein
MNNELKKINELYDIILSNKKIIHEQIAKGVTSMFGDSKVVFDKTSEGAVPPKGWKHGYKFIIQNSTDVFSPVEGTVEQVSSSNGRFYVYISSNGNQIYVGNLNSSNLSRGTKLKIRDKIGSVSSGSFVYVASNPTPISSVIDVSGNITNISGTGIDLFSDNNKGVNLTAKMIGRAMRSQSQNESSTKNRKKIINEVLVKVSEVENQYPNIKFAVKTQNDSINKALLDDINSAAASIGAIVTVDYAKTGHKKDVKNKPGVISRHWRQLAVDIDYIIIGGKTYVVNPENRAVVEKFTNVLQNMGYNKNAEGDSNPKAFLTFGADGHDDHVHVSNTTGESSGIPDFDPTIPDFDPSDGVEEILDKTVFKGMTPVEKAAAIKKLKDAGIWTIIIGAGVGVISLLPMITKTLKSGVEKVTDDSSYGGKQPQVNMTAKYIGNLLRLALPF